MFPILFSTLLYTLLSPTLRRVPDLVQHSVEHTAHLLGGAATSAFRLHHLPPLDLAVQFVKQFCDVTSAVGRRRLVEGAGHVLGQRLALAGLDTV